MAFTTPAKTVGHNVAQHRTVKHISSGALEFSSQSPSSKSAAEKIATEKIQATKSFRSPKFRVYIEDTDAYGVMYNSNYVRAYERALLQYAPLSKHRSAVESAEWRKWVLSSINSQKFRSSPALGENYVIRGELIESSYDGAFMETWELELLTENGVVHNSATITMSAPSYATSQQISLNQNGKVLERSYMPYHDEFTHFYDAKSFKHNYYIPMRNVMNFFERSRTDLLGGPDSLRKMQVEDDLIWVVTSVENGRLLVGGEHFVSESSVDDISVDDYLPESEMKKIVGESKFFYANPGKEVIVQTAVEVKRRGMIIECHQSLLMADKQNQKKLLAQATVTCVALKGSTRRPTSKLPQWVQELIV